MPKISCIMPVYNTAKYLEECIESILNQTYNDFEFIISDDGSTDWSKDIIKRYAEKDNRIIFLDNPKNRWIVANLNDCLIKASWKYIAIMESDDISMTERFEIEMQEFINDNDLMLVWTQWYLIKSDWDNISLFPDMNYDFSTFKNRYLYKYTFSSPSVIFKKEIINKVWNFESNLLWDFNFYSNVIFSKLKCKNIDKILVKKRVHPESLWAKKYFRITTEYYKLRNKFVIKYKLWMKFLIYNSIFYLFDMFIWLARIITKKLWIYKILSYYYIKYILRRDTYKENYL